MLVVTTAKLYNDSAGRLFCKSYKIVPTDKFNVTTLKPNQYAYAPSDASDLFWEKYPIFYVDTSNNNKLTCAYEYEDAIESLKFIDTEVIGINGALSDNALIQTLQLAVKTLSSKVADYDAVKASIASLTKQVTDITNRVKALEADNKLS